MFQLLSESVEVQFFVRTPSHIDNIIWHSCMEIYAFFPVLDYYLLFLALNLCLFLRFGAFLIFFLFPTGFPFQIILMKLILSRFILPHFFQFFGCRLFLRHSRRYVFPDKVKINLYLLCSVCAPIAVTFMHNDFLHKLILQLFLLALVLVVEHGITYLTVSPMRYLRKSLQSAFPVPRYAFRIPPYVSSVP